MKRVVPRFTAALLLSITIASLRADVTNAPATRLGGEALREQLKRMPPEERRAKIAELRRRLVRRPEPINQLANIPPHPARSMTAGAEDRITLLLGGMLTVAQRHSLQSAIVSQRAQTQELEEKIRTARKALFPAGLTEKFDEHDVRAQALEVGKLEAELFVLRAKAFAQINPPLSTNQIERIAKKLPLIERMAESPQIPLHVIRAPSASPPVSIPAEARDEHKQPPPAPMPEK